MRINYEVPGVSRFIDIYFIPLSQPIINPISLGLLSRITLTPCLLEPYRNPPSLDEVCSCLQKELYARANFQRQAKLNNQRWTEEELPRLWIIAPTVSNNILNYFGGALHSDWVDGIYFFVSGLRTAVIAANKLPPTQETLLLRIFGNGEVQAQAFAEISALPINDSRRSTVMQLLSTWKLNIEITGEVDTEDEELMMILSRAYQEWERETELRGMERGMLTGMERGMERGMELGVERGQNLLVENLLRGRFGKLDEQLLAIIPSLLALNPEQYTALLLQLSSMSREELLARFQTSN